MADNPWLSGDRAINIRGNIYTTRNSTRTQLVDLTPANVVSYSIDERGGMDGFPLGAVISASYTLELDNSEKRYIPRQFFGAEVHVEIGIKDGNTTTWSPFGVWWVDDIDAPEQSTTMTLTGMDALGTHFENYCAARYDGNIYNIGEVAEGLCSYNGVRIADRYFTNYDTSFDARHDSPLRQETISKLTYRDIISAFAAVAGGFARMTKDNKLYIRTYSSDNTGDNIHTLHPNEYQTLALTGMEPFAFNRLIVESWDYQLPISQYGDPTVKYTEIYINNNIPATPANTIQTSAPSLKLIVDPMAMFDGLKYLSSEAGTLAFGGDPRWNVGDVYHVTDLRGEVHTLIATSQSIQYDGGLTMSISCELPASSSPFSGSYNISSRYFDSYGNVRQEHNYSSVDIIDGSGGVPDPEYYVQPGPEDTVTGSGADYFADFDLSIAGNAPGASTYSWLYELSGTSMWRNVSELKDAGLVDSVEYTPSFLNLYGVKRGLNGCLFKARIEFADGTIYETETPAMLTVGD